MKSRRALDLLCTLALVAIAFGLRVYRLGGQSLWGDEAISVFRAASSLAEITAEAPREGTLPPLYYYVLHFWMPLAGRSEVAVRFPSLLFGVLTVPLVYVLARRTLGTGTAVLAAGAAAVSPFWIYYSQETRTYAQVTALAVLALYLLARAGTDRPWAGSRWPWVAYSLVAALALSSYYFAGFVLAAGVLWLLADRRAWPEVAYRCVLAQAGAILLLAPLLLLVAPSLVSTAGSVSRGGIPLSTILQHLVVTFSFGSSVEAARVTPVVVVALLLIALGLVATPRRAAAFWFLTLVIPVLAIYAVSFNPHRGWARYFMTASPAWYVLLAAGLRALGTSRSRTTWSRLLRACCAATAAVALLLGVGASLWSYYFDPSYWRYDFRSAVRQVEAFDQESTAVVVNGPPRFPSFFYYFQGSIPHAELPSPGSSAARTIATLDDLAREHRGLWLVKYRPPDYDPDGLVEGWLGRNAHKVAMTWLENTTLGFYVTRDPEAPRVVASFPVAARFGEDAELVGYEAEVVRVGAVDHLLVTLSWRALRTPAEDLRIFAHLLDAGDARLAQSDHRPVDDLRPTWTWRPGETLEDRFALSLPSVEERDGLRLAVGLFRPDGRRVTPTTLGSPDGSLALPLPGLAPSGPEAPYLRQLGRGIALRGYDLAPASVAAGEKLALRLHWRRVGPIDRDYTVFVHLLDAAEKVVAQRDSPPFAGRRPTASWLEGEELVDEYVVEVPSALMPGRYRIEVGMYEPDTGRRLSVLEPAEAIGAQGAPNRPDEDRALLPDVVEVLPRER